MAPVCSPTIAREAVAILTTGSAIAFLLALAGYVAVFLVALLGIGAALMPCAAAAVEAVLIPILCLVRPMVLLGRRLALLAG
jgi:hypothetical protein